MGVGIGSANSEEFDRFLERLSNSSATDRVDALVTLAVSNPESAYALLIHALATPQEFVSFIERVSQQRGIGSGLKRALTAVLSSAPPNWFVGLPAIESLDGREWSWRKVVQILHPKGSNFEQELRFAYMAGAIPEAGRIEAERLIEVIGIGRPHSGPGQRNTLATGIRGVSTWFQPVQAGGPGDIVRAGGGDADGDAADASACSGELPDAEGHAVPPGGESPEPVG